MVVYGVFIDNLIEKWIFFFGLFVILCRVIIVKEGKLEGKMMNLVLNMLNL